MAVWQFTVALLPQQWIDAGGDIRSLFEEGGFESAAAWRGYREHRLRERLGAHLPQGRSWDTRLLFWGRTDSDDIQLWLDENRVESVQVRFDLREPNFALFRKVASIATDMHLSIVSLETKAVLRPEVDQLLRAAAESAAAHFVIDPESFLLQMSAANGRPA